MLCAFVIGMAARHAYMSYSQLRDLLLLIVSYIQAVFCSACTHSESFIVVWLALSQTLQSIPAKGPGHLYGRTCFGDSVDDEWFIVYLLRQLTLAFPGLIAKYCSLLFVILSCL